MWTMETPMPMETWKSSPLPSPQPHSPLSLPRHQMPMIMSYLPPNQRSSSVPKPPTKLPSRQRTITTTWPRSPPRSRSRVLWLRPHLQGKSRSLQHLFPLPATLLPPPRTSGPT
uniref:Alternative protein PPP1R13B n=1 Tax=Homo sapiens TaxID=9606 RepID=L8EAS9_HUMAN|nr:alternative protein PPP1R13B [Homo sapiens]